MKTARSLSLLIATLLMLGGHVFAEETQLAAATQPTDEISEQNKANFDSLINDIESHLASSEVYTETQTATVNPTATSVNITPASPVIATAPSSNPSPSVNNSNTAGVNAVADNTKTSVTTAPAEKKSKFSLVEMLQLAASVASLIITAY